MDVMQMRLDSPVALGTAVAGTGALLVLLLLRRRPRSWLPRTLAAVIGAASLGAGVVWLLSDRLDVFGIPITSAVRYTVAAAFAGLALALVSLIGARRPRRVLAALAIPAVLLTAALALNAEFGQFPTLAAALDDGRLPALVPPLAPATALDVSTPGFATAWNPPADLPAQGRLSEADIPGTVSGFVARPADVYLPPAALVPDPPRLPVMVMFSGQPGAPEDLFASGSLTEKLDAYAVAHHGLAPIVVIPDQLGAPERNPMCVDSPLGNSATYVLTDVVGWIEATLPVTEDHRYWGIGGFSQGGTCTAQFGAAHPELFRTWLDISGENAPTIGDDTVSTAFGGSQAAYDAAKPPAILAARAPYTDVTAIVGYGDEDDRYGPEAQAVADAASAAGITTTVLVSPGTAHDWNTVQYVFDRALPLLGTRLGLSP